MEFETNTMKKFVPSLHARGHFYSLDILYWMGEVV